MFVHAVWMVMPYFIRLLHDCLGYYCTSTQTSLLQQQTPTASSKVVVNRYSLLYFLFFMLWTWLLHKMLKSWTATQETLTSTTNFCSFFIKALLNSCSDSRYYYYFHNQWAACMTFTFSWACGSLLVGLFGIIIQLENPGKLQLKVTNDSLTFFSRIFW